jgi:ATP synthase protein I
MANPPERDGQKNEMSDHPEDANLSARLKSLDARIGQVSAQRAKAEPSNRPTSDSKAVGQAMRLSAEFVSGVLAGGLIGWVLDRVFGWSPWGLIICLILGFCAGMLNLMRASGLVKAARYDEKK